MTRHITDTEATPIYTALIREMPDPSGNSWDIPPVPEFAETLARRAFTSPQSEHKPASGTPRQSTRRKAKKPAKTR